MKPCPVSSSNSIPSAELWWTFFNPFQECDYLATISWQKQTMENFRTCCYNNTLHTFKLISTDSRNRNCTSSCPGDFHLQRTLMVSLNLKSSWTCHLCCPLFLSIARRICYIWEPRYPFWELVWVTKFSSVPGLLAWWRFGVIRHCLCGAKYIVTCQLLFCLLLYEVVDYLKFLKWSRKP